MKNLTSTVVTIGFTILTISCNSGGEGKKVEEQDPIRTETLNAGQQAVGSFDIQTIPISDKDLGAFPFFSLPQQLAEQNKPVSKTFDQLFFPIDSVMTPLEGKTWKSNVVMAKGSKETWSLPYFLKSYDDAIKNAGGVKIFEGKVSNAEMNRIKDQATYFGEEGSIDYWNEPIKVYAIRRANGDDVYIQLSGSTAVGQIQILQKVAFKQTITMLKADQIQKDLAEKGKAVLYINFDTDKASLKADGKDAVTEIIKALNADKSLKIAINGYTDNTGNAKRNLELSKQRAETVKNELVTSGIAAARLSSAGFGQNNPIAENTSEEGKAQNRRVELVKQ